MGCPKCPYCSWEIGEWADGKTKHKEFYKCPSCDKTWHCTTYPSGNGYEHFNQRLGRKPKK